MASALSVRMLAMMPCEMVPRSSSAIITGMRDGPELGPEKIEPKNDAIAIGAAKLMMTARRSLKNSCRSLRTMAMSGVIAISRGGSVP